jgi:protein-disulfide isomerase
VFDGQAALTPETGDETLKNAVTKAGLDPAAVDACAATPAIKDQVNASIKLAQDVGVEQTPMLAVNGHLLPLAGIPYETLKNIISYQAMLDGVSTGATGPAVGSSSVPPTLGK